MSNGRNNQRQITTALGTAPLVGASPSGEALLREGPEPTVDLAPLPVLFIALSALLVYAAARNMNNRGGEFDPRVYYPYANLTAVGDAHPKNPADRLRLLGKQTFNTVGCVSCHQASGQGVPGQFPPLA
ncbi:MAG TPA: c-type cytochrome, partial [Verrucomicrobiae bacterium]|nr:c-type cytochrome [Verrucomicrobiae bacterium]